VSLIRGSLRPRLLQMLLGGAEFFSQRQIQYRNNRPVEYCFFKRNSSKAFAIRLALALALARNVERKHKAPDNLPFRPAHHITLCIAQCEGRSCRSHRLSYDKIIRNRSNCLSRLRYPRLPLCRPSFSRSRMGGSWATRRTSMSLGFSLIARRPRPMLRARD
jgi:hypothetical protein